MKIKGKDFEAVERTRTAVDELLSAAYRAYSVMYCGQGGDETVDCYPDVPCANCELHAAIIRTEQERKKR